MELLTFILSAYGLTQIIVYGKLFNKIRPSKGRAGELFKCPMCMGFHVGWFLMLLSPFTELFSFEYKLVTAFLIGCLSAGTTYFLSMILDDFGIKINLRRNKK